MNLDEFAFNVVKIISESQGLLKACISTKSNETS